MIIFFIHILNDSSFSFELFYTTPRIFLFVCSFFFLVFEQKLRIIQDGSLSKANN